MKAFGVRFAAGALTILLGAIMAAQAQKDQQETTESAWTEEQLPDSDPPMPIGLIDQIASGDLGSTGETQAGVIADEPAPESADLFDAPGAVALVQHTESAMEFPPVDSVTTAETSDAPKAAFQFPTFDEAPEMKPIETSGTTNDSETPSFSMGLPSVPSDSTAGRQSQPQTPPTIGNITFADTPGAQPSTQPDDSSPATGPMGPGPKGLGVPVNDLRGAGGPALGASSMPARPQSQSLETNAPGAPDFGQAIAQLRGERPPVSDPNLNEAPPVRFSGQGPVQVGIGEPLPRSNGNGSMRGGANQHDFAADNHGYASDPSGMPMGGPSFEPPAAMALEMRSMGQPPASSSAYEPAVSKPYDAADRSDYGAANVNSYDPSGNPSYDAAQGNALSQPPFGAPARATTDPAAGTMGMGGRSTNPNAYPTRPAAFNQDRRGTPFSTASSQLDRLPAPASRYDGAGRNSAGSVGLSMATPGEHRLDGPQNAAVVIDKRAPDEVKVGRPASFVITVRNVGAVKATDVRVFDRIPTGTKLEDSTPPPNPKFQPELYWELGDMEPGEERVITLQLVPMQEGELGSVATVAYRASASVRTVSTRPELKVVQRAPERVLIGQQVEIELEVSNPGTGEATGVVIQEDVPEGLLHPQGKKLDSVIGTLGPGEMRRQILRMKAVQPGLIENLIRVKGDDGLETAHTVALEVIAPDLLVGVAGPSRRYLERQATYEVKVANAGTADAQNLELSVQLDRGFTFVKTNNQGQYDPSRHAVFWSLHSLPAGTDASVDLTLLPVEEGTRLLRADVTADLGVTAFSENQVSVDSLAELTFSISDTADPIEIGGQTVYEIRVNNSGSRDDTNVEVLLQLPQGLQLIEEGDFTPKGQGYVAFPPRALLKANDEMVFRVKAQGIQPGRHLVKAVVRSDQSDVPVTKEESIMVYSDR
ncbi:MAG: hypothetical protein AAF802_09570 [Planctomycetota bacterium]